MATKPKFTPRAKQVAEEVEDVETTAVATRKTGAVALPADLMAELGAAAKDEAARERPAVSRISLKSGVMNIGGDAIPGNTMDVVIVGGAYRNTFYAGDYDADNIVNPDCFALSDSGEDMVPHENVTEPVHETCDGCPNNEWGSAARGRGKACKQGRRLILLPADCLESEETVLKAEMAIMDIPVTSVKNYATLVSGLAASINLPVWAVVTTVSVKPDPRTQFKVVFDPTHPAGDEAIIRALMKRRDEALRIALRPFEGTGGEADPEAAKPKAPAKTAHKFTAKRK